MVAVETSKEIEWIRNILTEFGYSPSYALTLFINNKSNIKIIKNLEHHGYETSRFVTLLT